MSSMGPEQRSCSAWSLAKSGVPANLSSQSSCSFLVGRCFMKPVAGRPQVGRGPPGDRGQQLVGKAAGEAAGMGPTLCARAWCGWACGKGGGAKAIWGVQWWQAADAVQDMCPIRTLGGGAAVGGMHAGLDPHRLHVTVRMAAPRAGSANLLPTHVDDVHLPGVVVVMPEAKVLRLQQHGTVKLGGGGQRRVGLGRSRAGCSGAGNEEHGVKKPASMASVCKLCIRCIIASNALCTAEIRAQIRGACCQKRTPSLQLRVAAP